LALYLQHNHDRKLETLVLPDRIPTSHPFLPHNSWGDPTHATSQHLWRISTRLQRQRC